MLEGCRQQMRWTHSIRSARGAVYRLCLGGLIVGSTVALALGPARAQTQGQNQPQTQIQSPAQPQAQSSLNTQPQPAPLSAVAQNTAITQYDNSFSIFPTAHHEDIAGFLAAIFVIVCLVWVYGVVLLNRDYKKVLKASAI